VLPVPLTPTISSTAGSVPSASGARPVDATSATISISRRWTDSPSAATAPPSTSCSSRSTIAAAVGAPTSARISASSSRSQGSSSIRSKRLAEISSVSARRLFERLSRRRRKTPRRSSSLSGPEVLAVSRDPRSMISSQPVAIAAGGYLGRLVELLESVVDVGGDRLEVGDRVAVGDQAEEDLPVVAEDRDREGVAAGEEADRVDADQFAAEDVERDLRAGEVGDEHVEEAGREVDRRRRPQQDRRREVAEPVVQGPDRFRAEWLLGGLQLLHPVGHLAQALDR